MFEQDQWFYLKWCSNIDQQSQRRWCYETNQQCSISTMLQTTMMLWFWSTMSRMTTMFQYWSMMLQIMVMLRLLNLAKRMKTRFKDINTWSKKWRWNQRCWKWKKRMSSTSTTQNYRKWYHHKHYSQTRVWIHVIPCWVKQSTQSMTETGIQCPLSRVTGPCLG